VIALALSFFVSYLDRTTNATISFRYKLVSMVLASAPPTDKDHANHVGHYTYVILGVDGKREEWYHVDPQPGRTTVEKVPTDYVLHYITSPNKPFSQFVVLMSFIKVETADSMGDVERKSRLSSTISSGDQLSSELDCQLHEEGQDAGRSLARKVVPPNPDKSLTTGNSARVVGVQADSSLFWRENALTHASIGCILNESFKEDGPYSGAVTREDHCTLRSSEITCPSMGTLEMVT
jgi:hypothetical protein